MKTPETYNGKNLAYEEVFRSAHAYATEKEAQKVLDDIRNVHDGAHGWVELEPIWTKPKEVLWQYATMLSISELHPKPPLIENDTCRFLWEVVTFS